MFLPNKAINSSTHGFLPHTIIIVRINSVSPNFILFEDGLAVCVVPYVAKYF